jgi:thiol-disulfide isomerase/thioredoxin
MNRKIGFPLLLISIILGLACYAISETNKLKRLKIISENAQRHLSNLPNRISFLENNLTSIFIAFNPDCEHCQYEAKSINERHREFGKTNIVMFTEEKDSVTKAFSKQYGLDTLKNVQVISDTTHEMDKVLGVKHIPTIFIYNKNNELVKRYDGETKIDAILKYIQ